MMTYQFSSAQCIDIKGKSDWEQVSLIEMPSIEEQKKSFNFPEGCELAGEYVINLEGSKSTLENLSAVDIKSIKRKIAKYKGCIGYVDVKNYSVDAEDEIYFYWCRKK